MRQPVVIKTEQVKNRRMQIIYMDSILDRCPANFIRLSVNLPPLDTSTCPPQAKAIGMVVTPGILFGTTAIFPQRGTTKLAGTDDQGFIRRLGFHQI